MTDIPEGEIAQTDNVPDVERRLRALHEVMHEAITGDLSEDDLHVIFTDIERASQQSRTPGSMNVEGVSKLSRVLGSMNEVTRLQPRQRVIIACDVEPGSRTSLAKAALRSDMYDLIEAALLECNITEDVREPFYDRGDGAMVLLRPVDEVPKTVLLHTFVPVLSEMLSKHARRQPRRMFWMRLAIHSGEVHFDRRGVFGADIDLTFRLLNSQALMGWQQESEVPLAVGVSDHIHRSIVARDRDAVDIRAFERSIAIVMDGRRRRVGWIYTPGRRGQYDTQDENAHADRAG